MKNKLVIIFIAATLVVFGKSYAPKGTIWHYGTTTSFSSSKDFVKFEVIDTALIGGKMCSVIQHNRSLPACEYQSALDYLYEENNVVYYYLQDSTKFKVLFDFNTIVGGTWLINDQSGNVTATVDSIDTVTILGKDLKRLWVTYTPFSGIKFSSQIIEKIGEPDAWFNFFGWNRSSCDIETYSGLRCLYNPDLGLYKTGTVDCEYTVGIKNSKNETLNITFVNGQLVIKSETQIISSIKLITINGSIFYEDTHVKQNFYNRAVNYTGVIFCVVSLKNGEVVVEKIFVDN